MLPGPVERSIVLGSPAFLWLLIFLALPLLSMFLISLAERGPYGVVLYRLSYQDYQKSLEVTTDGQTPSPRVGKYVGFLARNYLRAFDPMYLAIYGRSLVLAGLTTLLCLLLGYPIAYWIARKAPEGWRNALLLLVVIPFWTSFLVRTYAWILILRTDGLVNTLLLQFKLALTSWGFSGFSELLAPPYSLLYNDWAVLIGLVYGELPFMILPLYASIQKLNPTLLEAAADLGARPVQAFLTVTLPLTWPGIMAGVIFVFIPSIGAFVVPDLMGGSKSIMVGNLIQNQFAVTRDLPFGSAVCFLLTGVILFVLYVKAALAGEDEEKPHAH